MDDPSDDDSENTLVKLTSLVVLGVGLTTLFLGYDWFWLVFALGFAVVLPAVKLLTRALGLDDGERDHADHDNRKNRAPRERTADTESKQDALDTLRDRYARGDLTEAEFERKVEALLETETPESARKHVERTKRAERANDSARETETETSR